MIHSIRISSLIVLGAAYAGTSTANAGDAPAPPATREVAGSLPRERFAALSPVAQSVVRDFLLRDCGVSERSTIEKKLADLGTAVEEVFWEAHRLGPPRDEVDLVSAAAAASYSDRQKWLREHGDEVLGKEETHRQLAVTRDQFIAAETNQFVQRYKSAALNGVGTVGTNRSVELLQKIAADEKNPQQISAREAVRKLQQKSGQ